MQRTSYYIFSVDGIKVEVYCTCTVQLDLSWAMDTTGLGGMGVWCRIRAMAAREKSEGLCYYEYQNGGKVGVAFYERNEKVSS